MTATNFILGDTPATTGVVYFQEGYCHDFHEVAKPSGGFTSAQQCYDKIMDENIAGCAIGAGLKFAIGKAGGSRAGRCLCQKQGTSCVVTGQHLGSNGLDVWVCEGTDCRGKNFCFFLSRRIFLCCMRLNLIHAGTG